MMRVAANFHYLFFVGKCEKTLAPHHDVKIHFVKLRRVNTNAPGWQECMLNLSYWKPNNMRVDFFDGLFLILRVIVSFRTLLFPSDQIKIYE